MSKKHSRVELEHLKGLVRQKEKIIKNLKKQVSRSNKRIGDLDEQYAEEILQDDYIEEEFIDKELCPVCKGEIDITELGQRVLITCQSCNFRKTRKNV